MANEIKLQEGHPVDENLRPLKIGGKTTAIETAQHGDGARVNGDLEITGLTRTHKINTSIINGISATGDPALEIRVGEATADVRRLDVSDTNGSNFFNISHNETDSITLLSMYSVKQSGTNLFMIKVLANGETHLQTTNNGDLILSPDLGLTGGDVYINNCNLIITAEDKLIFDGAGPTEGDSHTYIAQTSADVLDVYVGGDNVLKLTESGNDGNLVDFGTSGAGFTQHRPTFDADDTLVYFNRLGNKASFTFDGDNITDLHLFFPGVSCNCILKIIQDGTGSRTITNYKTFDQAGGNESTVLFAGGSNPTLTTTASKADILSFYWDNDEHKAYGVATLNF